MRKNSFIQCNLMSSQLMGRFGFNANHEKCLQPYFQTINFNKMLVDPWTRSFSSEKPACGYDFIYNQLRADGPKKVVQKAVSSAAVNPQFISSMSERRGYQRSIEFSKKIRKYANVSDMDTCLIIYESMLKQNVRPLASSTTSMFVVIGNCSRRRTGVQALHKLHELLNYYNVKLNEMNYVSALQTCCKLQCGHKGLNFYDEMKQKGIIFCQDMYRHVFECIFYSNENTLETNLIIWHTMLKSGSEPKLTLYKILLSNLIYAQCSTTKLEKYLTRGTDRVEIHVQENGETNLLARPPVLSKTSLSRTEDENGDINLKDTFEKDKLLLFGGYNNILRTIKAQGYTPDEMVLTWLLHLLPDSIFLEDELVNQAEKMQVQLTAHFFNTLIKRRCFRFEYEAAKDVLACMEVYGVKPNDSTWAALAYTCHHYTDIEKFLYLVGEYHGTANEETLRTLIKNVGHTKSNYKFYNLSHLMRYMSENQLRPSEKIIQLLDSIVTQCEDLKNKRAEELASNIHLINYSKFLNFYNNWRYSYQRNIEKN